MIGIAAVMLRDLKQLFPFHLRTLVLDVRKRSIGFDRYYLSLGDSDNRGFPLSEY